MSALGLVALVAPGRAHAQVATPLQCSAFADPVTVRAEGLTEPLADVSIACTGGAPTAGQPPAVNVVAVSSVTVTNNPAAPPTLEVWREGPVPACGYTATVSGVPLGSNQVAFPGVTFPTPVVVTPTGQNASCTTFLRVHNIRANVSGLKAVGTTAAQVYEYVAISGSTNLAVNNPVQTVAYVKAGLLSAYEPVCDQSDLFVDAQLDEGFATAITEGDRLLLRFTGASSAMVTVPDYTTDLVRVEGADPNGKGGAALNPALADDGSVELALGSGAAVTYEVVDADPTKAEAYTVPLAAVGAEFSPLTVSTGFAPQSTVGVASSTEPIPRFIVATSGASEPVPFLCCTRTLGYWKTHPEAWSAKAMTIGGRVMSKADALKALDASPRGDATYILAHQLIAAKQNVAAGVPADLIAADVYEADALLATNPLGSNPKGSSRAMLIDAAAVLDLFNNGELGVGHCQ